MLSCRRLVSPLAVGKANVVGSFKRGSFLDARPTIPRYARIPAERLRDRRLGNQVVGKPSEMRFPMPAGRIGGTRRASQPFRTMPGCKYRVTIAR